MSKTVYFAMYPTDFLADVGHLGNTELGIYWRLLLVYYRDQRPLPFDTDKLRRLAMTFSPEEGKALDAVMADFFVLATEPDGTRCWRHKRADLEIEKAGAAHDRKSAGAASTNAKRWGSVAKRVAKRSDSDSGSESASGRKSESESERDKRMQKPAADAAHSGSPEPDDPPADSPRQGDEPVDVDKVLFDAGIGLLSESRGPQQARAIVGRLRKNLGADEALRLIVDARGTTDPAAYLMAAEKRHIVAAKIRAATGKDVKHLPDGRYYAYPNFYSADGRREVHV